MPSSTGGVRAARLNQERTIRNLLITSVISALSIAGCNGGRDTRESLSNEDRAVILVALEDFAVWDQATFGNLKGVLSVASQTAAPKDLSVESVRREASRIDDAFDDGLAAAFVARNQSAVSSTPLIVNSSWAQKLPENWEYNSGRLPPVGAKATGWITLPGFNNDRTRALLQVRHSWSIHGATITYVLERTDGHWRVAARDQEIYL